VAHAETTCQDTDLGFSTTAQATYLLLSHSPAVSHLVKRGDLEVLPRVPDSERIRKTASFLRGSFSIFLIEVPALTTSPNMAKSREVVAMCDLTHTAHGQLGVLLVHPGVLHGSCGAKYAAALFKAIPLLLYARIFTPQALQLLVEVCIIDLLLLTGRPMICPDPGMERVFIHPQVTGRLRDRWTRFDGEFRRTLLQFGRIRFHRWLTHRTHL
jgi:hypothetical protein